MKREYQICQMGRHLYLFIDIGVVWWAQKPDSSEWKLKKQKQQISGNKGKRNYTRVNGKLPYSEIKSKPKYFIKEFTVSQVASLNISGKQRLLGTVAMCSLSPAWCVCAQCVCICVWGGENHKSHEQRKRKIWYACQINVLS